MICLIGLGNPGSEYASTRHNIGFMVLDRLAKELGLSWKNEFGVCWGKTDQALLIEPQEFMNVSGPTVKDFLDKKKYSLFDVHDIVIVHDDLDFPLGEIHEQHNRSAAGHNGVQSMIDAFNTQAFRRLRIGIGNNRDHGVPAETFVLRPFTAEEKAALQPVIDKAATRLQQLLSSQ